MACHQSEAGQLGPSVEFQGTPAYAAPELIQDESQAANMAVDVYGLGAILYALITGQPPFSGRNSLEVWDKIRQSEPPRPRTLNTRIDRDLEAICLRALAKDTTVRYPSAAALVDDLQRYLARKPVAARPIGWWHRCARWLRRHTVGRTIALTGAVAAFALLAVITVQSIALRDQKTKTEAAHLDVERYRQALEVAENKFQRQPALTAEPPSLP